ncbi:MULTISPECIES: hypothetical protein [Shewanella]|jgi:hypothetical protein|uniref:Uncharacterized protein n=1 Tax=Shewanella psychromarinicola TaxID=2487742 RepID=A0A3N4DYP3_9GAMM|nr:MULTISPECIES: hypothetical protein [Shewanella]AZG33764.1 hypothetical protein EGC80_01700 [Shewanella psychromarinicola]MCL1084167.1 hypothetical protein [Shewanella psychromarinicola]PKG78809.1 hypothetical protein CXF80_11090 [Shewanella sp. Actino-trap-3]RPA22524.1 hypothetical protein EGC77_21720 [Shewanella psychromarinicola]
MNHKKDLPVSSLRFWIERISKTSLRALHIIGVVGSGGGMIFNLELSLWFNYWLIAITSGVLLVSWEIIRDWRWLIQLKGVLTLLKVILLGLFIQLSECKSELVIFIILLSVIVSHGPAGLRHYSIVHRKVIQSKKEIKG